MYYNIAPLTRIDTVRPNQKTSEHVKSGRALPQECRTVFRLRYLEGMNTDTLHLNIETVKARKNMEKNTMPQSARPLPPSSPCSSTRN